MLALERELTLSADQVRSRAAFRDACARTWGPRADVDWDWRFNSGLGAYRLPCERVRLECLRRIEDGAAMVTVRLTVDSATHSIYRVGLSSIEIDAHTGESRVVAERRPVGVFSAIFPQDQRGEQDGLVEPWPAA
jgi:hypothetical protein